MGYQAQCILNLSLVARYSNGGGGIPNRAEVAPDAKPSPSNAAGLRDGEGWALTIATSEISGYQI